MSSSRFPQKMLKQCGNLTLVEYVFERCLTSTEADLIKIVTSEAASDDCLYEYCMSKKIPIARGPLENVLLRYVLAAEEVDCSIICRVCGDSPFVDVSLMDKMFIIAENEAIDYIAPQKSTCLPGLDSEVITLNTLHKISKINLTEDEREHVTLYIRDHLSSFNTKIINSNLQPKGIDNIFLTVDYPIDLLLINEIISFLNDKYDFTSDKIFDILLKQTYLLEIINLCKSKRNHE